LGNRKDIHPVKTIAMHSQRLPFRTIGGRKSRGNMPWVHLKKIAINDC